MKSTVSLTWPQNGVLGQPAIEIDLDATISATGEPEPVICYRCGQPIDGANEDPEVVHPDHERWCDGPDTGCDCDLPTHAGCCEWCEREDFPDVGTWLLHKMTMEHQTIGVAVLNACWVLRTAKSSSLPGLRHVWTRIVTEACYVEEIEAALAEVGFDLDTIRWDELRGTWYDTVKQLDEAGELRILGDHGFAPEPAEAEPELTFF